jgi:putative tricarboxylic transport membrane protein
MSQGIESPGRPRARGLIRNQDFWGGLALLLIAALAVIAGAGGTAITLRIFAAVITVFGVVLVAFAMNGRHLIRAPQDFWGGLALLALALFAIWAASDLPGQRGFAFGPGTAPRLFAGLLAVFGIVIGAFGIMFEGPPLERFGLRGVIFIAAAILSFAAMIRPVGLVPATFLAFLIAAAASNETRWIESSVMAVAMTIFCVFLFVYMLNLPFQLWPRWF